MRYPTLEYMIDTFYDGFTYSNGGSTDHIASHVEYLGVNNMSRILITNNNYEVLLDWDATEKYELYIGKYFLFEEGGEYVFKSCTSNWLPVVAGRTAAEAVEKLTEYVYFWEGHLYGR